MSNYNDSLESAKVNEFNNGAGDCNKSPDPFSIEPIAHSADPENGIEHEQRYSVHVNESENRGLKTFDEIAPYLNYPKKLIKILREILKMVLEYHDLGKLEDLCQQIIRDKHKQRMINHVDAGTAFFLRKYKESNETQHQYLFAAILVHAHHIGILNMDLNPDANEDDRTPINFKEVAKNIDLLRDNTRILKKYPHYKDKVINEKETVSEYTDRILDSLLDKHRKFVIDSQSEMNMDIKDVVKFFTHPMLIRLLLSCVVEGDHWDTSRHYGGISPNFISLPLNAETRYDEYIKRYRNKSDGKNEFEVEKNKVRKMVHKDCEEVVLDKNFYGLYAFPGYGKTNSGAICLPLRLCKKFNLRGSIYVAPFNNILYQNIKTIEEDVVLNNEKKGEIVGENYQDASHYKRSQDSQMNYKLLKHIGTQWCCPFEIMSAVQFFNSVSGNMPFPLRKLHQTVGKVIEIDEFHTTVPARLIRQTMKWMNYMAEYWSVKFVLMSGSPVKFWEISEINSCGLEKNEEDIKIDIKEVLSEPTQKEMIKLDKKRIKYKIIEKKFESFEALMKRVKRQPGPVIVVFNTILSASIFANKWREKYGADKVEHLSTVLDPKDRKEIHDHIEKRLANKEDKDWILVSTSCVDTGVNFSFRTGFRENCCLLSSLQLGGRVNRSNEYQTKCNVFVFDMDHDKAGGSGNKAFNSSMKVQREMFKEKMCGYEYCTEALRRELIEKNIDSKYDDHFKKIEKMEKELCYKGVEEEFEIISHANKIVVVDPEIIKKIKNKEIVSYWEIRDNSVQIFFTKTDRKEYKDNMEEICYRKSVEDDYDNTITIWTGEYDPKFLGYMKEVLKDLGHKVY